jgi:hypothetical protein
MVSLSRRLHASPAIFPITRYQLILIMPDHNWRLCMCAPTARRRAIQYQLFLLCAISAAIQHPACLIFCVNLGGFRPILERHTLLSRFLALGGEKSN